MENLRKGFRHTGAHPKWVAPEHLHVTLFFLGKTAPAGLQLREFLTEAARVVGEPLLATQPAEDWKKALLAVTECWTRPEKLVLVLDEFQWMVEASPELPSVLQECWPG